MHLKVKEFQIQTRCPGESHQQRYNVDLIKKLNSITSKFNYNSSCAIFILLQLCFKNISSVYECSQYPLKENIDLTVITFSTCI